MPALLLIYPNTYLLSIRVPISCAFRISPRCCRSCPQLSTASRRHDLRGLFWTFSPALIPSSWPFEKKRILQCFPNRQRHSQRVMLTIPSSRRDRTPIVKRWPRDTTRHSYILGTLLEHLCSFLQYWSCRASRLVTEPLLKLQLPSGFCTLACRPCLKLDVWVLQMATVLV